MSLTKKFFAFSQPIENFFKFGDALHFVWKDTNSAFFGCSDFLGDEAGLTPSNMIGLDDRDLVWNNRAKQYRDDEIIVLNSRTTRCIYEPVKIINKEVTMLTFKTPLTGSSGLIEGVFAICFPLDQLPLPEITKLINQLGIMAPNHMLFPQSSNTIFQQLSKREQECLFYLTQGKSTKEIGLLLSLSPRTVESHIDNMKIKLHCHTRSELIGKVSGLENYRNKIE